MTAAEALLVKQLIAGYWQHAKGYYRHPDGTATSTLSTLKCVLKGLRALYGNLSATEFGPRRLQALRETWIQAGHSRTTCNAYTGHIVRCFRWGAASELISGDCYHALKAVSGLRAGRTTAAESEGVGTVNPWIVRRALRHASPTLSAMIRFQWRTGCRPHEVCDLRYDLIDRTGPVWQYRPLHHKTSHHGHGRVILVGPKAQRVLTAFETAISTSGSGHVFNPARAEEARLIRRNAGRVTPIGCDNRPGTNRKRCRRRAPKEWYSATSYGRAIRRACLKAGVPPFSPNQLRHNAATRVREQHGLEAAQVILGHRHARITEVYAERNLAFASRVVERNG